MNDARNLLLARQRETTLNVPHKGRTLYYAVTAVDRYGNESSPTTSDDAAAKPRRPLDFRRMILGNPQKSTN